MMKISKVWILALNSLVVSARPLAAGTIYVDTNATGRMRDVVSWCNAHRYSQDTFPAAVSQGGCTYEIRLGNGLYKPDQGGAQTSTDREATGAEKSIRNRPIAGPHTWWARRSLAACRTMDTIPKLHVIQDPTFTLRPKEEAKILRHIVFPSDRRGVSETER